MPTHTPASVAKILHEEYMKPYNLTGAKLAALLRVDVADIEEVLKDEALIDGDLALRLSRVFTTSPQFWLNLQAERQLFEASIDLNTRLSLQLITPIEKEVDSHD
jgi:addiction module HigA family antidote